MLVVIAALLAVLILVCLVGFVGVGSIIKDYLGDNNEVLKEIKRHQLNPRTRIAQAQLRNQPETVEDDMKRAGRIAAPHRVVVGGDDDSQLSHDLRRSRAVTDE